MEAISSKCIKLLFIVYVGVSSEAMEERSRTYIKRSDNEDMKASGSGYSYEIHSGEPYSYTSYNTDYSGNVNIQSAF